MSATPVKIVYHGHANLEIFSGSHRLQLDPFYTGNPLADVAAEAVKPNFILISHAHGDHLGDAEAMAKRTNATVISTHEIASWLSARGVKKVHGMNVGGGYNFDFGRVTMTTALHTSSFPDGTYGGVPAGFVIEIGGKTIYFAGDTGIFGDMALIGRLWNLDLAILPIGDNYTMSPQHAVEAAIMLKPRLVLPIHFATFPVIQQDPHAFVQNLQAKTGIPAQVLKPGQSLEL